MPETAAGRGRNQQPAGCACADKGAVDGRHSEVHVKGEESRAKCYGPDVWPEEVSWGRPISTASILAS